MPVDKRIRNYRADSAPYQAELFNQLEEDGMRYAITADQDKAVKPAIVLIPTLPFDERGCRWWGRIVRHAGEIVLKLMVDLEKLELFRGIRKKSFELSLCPDG
jgi:hypothetical protein